MTPTAETDASAAIAPSKTKEAAPNDLRKHQVSLFGQISSPERAAHQGVLSLADQGVASATNFLTGVIIARSCSKEELGLYMLGFSLVLFVTDLQTSLITTPYMVYAPRLQGRAHALYTGSTLIHQLAFCLITMFALMCGALAISDGMGPTGLGPVMWALLLVIAFIMLREHARRINFARLRLRAAFIFDTCIAVGQIGGLLVLAYFGLLSASRAYWVIGSVCAIAVLGWLWSDRRCYDLQVNESLTDLKKNWVLGKWVLASALVWAVSMNLYPWLLAVFHGVASAGVWAACVGVVSVGNPILLGIQNFAGPKLAQKYATDGHSALYHLVIRMTVLLAVSVSLLCLALFIYGGRLVVLLYGFQYAGNGVVVALLALNFLVGAIGFSFSRALFALDLAWIDFSAVSVALLIMITLGVWFVRGFGPLGAAIALLGANSIVAAVRVIAFLTYPNRTLQVELRHAQ